MHWQGAFGEPEPPQGTQKGLQTHFHLGFILGVYNVLPWKWVKEELKENA